MLLERFCWKQIFFSRYIGDVSADEANVVVVVVSPILETTDAVI